MGLEPVLDGEDPLGDFEPAGVKLLAQIAGILEELGDLFLAGAG